MKTRIWLLALMLSLVGSSALSKQPVLPEVAVEDADGGTVDLSLLHRNAHWVLVIVDEGWSQSAGVLQELDRPEAIPGSERISVVISTSAFKAADFAERYPNLKRRGYYVDKSQSLGPLLRLPAYPALLAINPDGEISWRNHGGMQPTARMRALLESWVDRPAKGEK